MEKIKEKNIYLAALIAMLLCLAANYICGKATVLIAQILKKEGHVYGEYTYSFIAELLFAICIVVIALIFKQSYVLSIRQFDLKKCLSNYATAGFFIFLALSGMAANYNVGIEEGYAFKSEMSIAVHTAYFLFVGFAEELLFRGVIADMLIRKLVDKKGGIIKSVIVSGVLFGAMHLLNLQAVDTSNIDAIEGVITQVVMASFMGMAFVAIYYRTKSFWTVAIVHALVDIGADSLNGWFKVKTTVVDSIASYDIRQLSGAFVYIIVLMVLLRKSKLEIIRQNFEEGYKEINIMNQF